MTTDISWLGTLILSGALVSASGSVALSLVSTSGLSSVLRAARLLLFTTFFLIAAATFLLAYAFQAHDFSLRYVAQYSDRSMSWPYLFAALWAGQDGSLLWWTFTLCGLCALCAYRLRDRASALQPFFLAALACIVGFFLLVMLFAADPFAKSINEASFDGEGLNPLLRNPWMLVHPPVLYLGMVGWAPPFAIAIAALFSGQLSNQWLAVARPWVLFAWVALAMGNVLGMIWSYEVLGWGGYWAWDPVENASFLPMLSGTAYLHSALVQQRRAMFKGWSVTLLCLTFFMTLFGTFLTRSGMIASVHAFSRSGMGVYFVVFMAIVALLSAGLIGVRRRDLRSIHRIEQLFSRDFILWLVNVIMMALLVFVATATIFPLLSEAFWSETIAVGAPFYNRWIAPVGLLLLVLLGFGPLTRWRGSTPRPIWRALRLPTLLATTVAVGHLAWGAQVGFPPFARVGQEAYTNAGAVARTISSLYQLIPLLSFALSTFAITAHLQELFGESARGQKGKPWLALLAFWRTLVRSRRRSGAYLVHVGVVFMCVGFTGSLYDKEVQAALRPGEAVRLGDYHVRFDQPRMGIEPARRMLLADLTVLRGGKALGSMTPGKYFYDKPPGTNTSDVAIRTNLVHDIYVILHTVNPNTRSGTFRLIIRPLVVWIWIGSLLVLLGTIICFTANPRTKRENERPETNP